MSVVNTIRYANDAAAAASAGRARRSWSSILLSTIWLVGTRVVLLYPVLLGAFFILSFALLMPERHVIPQLTRVYTSNQLFLLWIVCAPVYVVVALLIMFRDLRKAIGLLADIRNRIF